MPTSSRMLGAALLALLHPALAPLPGSQLRGPARRPAPVEAPSPSGIPSAPHRQAVARAVVFPPDDAVELTLEEAVERARREHPRIAAALLAAQAQSHRAEQVGRWPNPQASLYQETFPGAAPDTDQTILSFSQRLRVGGQLRLARQAAVASQRGIRFEADRTRERIVLELQRTYVGAWRAQASLAAIETARQAVTGLVADLEARLREGDVSRFDAARMRREQEALVTQQELASAQLESGWERIAFLTASEVPERGWRLRAPAGEGGPPAVGETARLPAVDDAATEPGGGAAPGGVGGEGVDLDNRFDLRAMQSRIEAAELRARLAGRQAVPDLVVTFGYTRLDPLLDGLVWSVGVEIPVLDRNDAARAAESAEAERARRQRQALMSEARSEVRAARREYERIDRVLAALYAGSEGREQLLPIARVAYQEGEMTVTGLLDAARAQLDAELRRAELEQLRADAWFRWRFAAGRYVGLGARDVDTEAH